MMATCGSRHARSSLVDIAYEYLKEQIFLRLLEPGQPIRIQLLAEGLDMSITPVREALARAAESGLATSDANRGYRVAPLLDSSQFHHLFGARRAIEVAAASGNELEGPHWVKSISDKDIRLLGDLVAKMGKVKPVDSYRQYTAFSRLDGELHRHLVRLSGNQFLLDAWEGLHFHLHVSRLYSGVGVVDFDAAQQEHTALVEALRDRNVQLLADLSSAHIRDAEQRLAERFHLLQPTGDD